VRISEGQGLAVSPDDKWVLTESSRGGPLSLVPSGAGEPRQLTHDSITYTSAQFMPDGKHLLAAGIEPGHGGRDYMIDTSTGESKPLTPEGTTGTVISPDGRKAIMRGPDGKVGIWSLDSNTLQIIPELDPKFSVIGWAPDGASVYAVMNQFGQKSAKLFKVNATTGKAEFWKEFGAGLSGGISGVSAPRFSRDGNAYAYIYVRILSQAYVAKGLK
jgi:Tol biopolymer transport system component